MTTWLSDGSANRHIKTYVKDFVDVNGNFTVRSEGSNIFNPNDTTNFVPGFGFTNNTSTNTTNWYPDAGMDASLQFIHNSDTGIYEIKDNSSWWWSSNFLEYYDNYTNGASERYRHINERSGLNLRMRAMDQSALRIDHYHGGVIVSTKWGDPSYLPVGTWASRWRFQVDGWGHLHGNTQNFNRISIYAVNNIVCDVQFFASRDDRLISDERIKTNIQSIDDASALDKLRLLNPCTYEYIDKKTMGPYNVEGFIAQEVKEVLPYAVDEMETSIPNIFQEGSYKRDASGNKVLIINDYDTANLDVDASGNIYPLLLYKADGGKVIDGTVAEVVSSTSLKLNTAEEPQDFFVYGQYVKDFNVLKKDHIFTVATAALQELDRQLQAEKLKKTTLETQVADLRARVNVLKGQ